MLHSQSDSLKDRQVSSEFFIVFTSPPGSLSDEALAEDRTAAVEDDEEALDDEHEGVSELLAG
jgi:hypothetical protein